jgi:hypothetical protein
MGMSDLDPEVGRIADLMAEVDSFVLDGQWDEVVALRDRCVAAAQRGHQWWPAAAWAEYRLALDAPGQFAASVLESSASRFTLGPFPEVAASSHAWDELSPFLERSPASATFAHECIALGDDLRADDTYAKLPLIFDLPATLQSWEPLYGPVVYHLDRVEHGAPIVNPFAGPLDFESLAADRWKDDATCEALRSLLLPWAQDPQWKVESQSFFGSPETLLKDPATPPIFLETQVGLALLAWAGASGGPSGRRRGLASARNDLWWALMQMTGLIDEDNPGGPSLAAADDGLLEELAAGVSELRFWSWTPTPIPGEKAELDGWRIGLIVDAPDESLMWAISAAPRVSVPLIVPTS